MNLVESHLLHESVILLQSSQSACNRSSRSLTFFESFAISLLLAAVGGSISLPNKGIHGSLGRLLIGGRQMCWCCLPWVSTFQISIDMSTYGLVWHCRWPSSCMWVWWCTSCQVTNSRIASYDKGLESEGIIFGISTPTRLPYFSAWRSALVRAPHDWLSPIRA